MDSDDSDFFDPDWDDHYRASELVMLVDGTRAKVLGLMAAVDHSFEVDRYYIEQAGARRYVEATEISGRVDVEPFVCVAYGGRPGAHAACFFTEVGRVCQSLLECAGSMDAERKRVYQVIQEGAAAGDEMMVWLAENLGSPDEMLNGPAVDPDSSGR